MDNSLIRLGIKGLSWILGTITLDKDWRRGVVGGDALIE